MTNLYSIKTLLENLEEIRKLKESERFRKVLKFFLIGFFIGRNNEKRIKELTSKTYDILSHLLEREFLEKNQTTIPEKSNIYESLTRIEEIRSEVADPECDILFAYLHFPDKILVGYSLLTRDIERPSNIQIFDTTNDYPTKITGIKRLTGIKASTGHREYGNLRHKPG